MEVIHPISVEEIKRAERESVKIIERTSKSRMVKKSSCIYSLDTILRDGILRVGGRLKNAPIAEESKYPAILPKGSHVSDHALFPPDFCQCWTGTCFVTFTGTSLDSWRQNYGENDPDKMCALSKEIGAPWRTENS